MPTTKRKKIFKKHNLLYAIISLLIIGAAVWVIAFVAHRSQTIFDLSDVRHNIHYCNTNDQSQTLDFYRPKHHDAEMLPVVVYIHGGGWRSGSNINSLIMKTYGPYFLKKNIAVASINYRLNSKYPYPDQNDDVACALTYLSENEDELKINAEKAIFFGDSAGGQLAAFAGLNIPYKDYDYDAPTGVIDFYGVSDFSKIVVGAHPDFNARRYLGSKYNNVASTASPTSYVTKKAPKFLFIHGDKDTVVPISQSKSLFDLLTSSGIDAEYVTVPGAGHAFIGPELPVDQYKLIQDSMNSFLLETILN